MKIHIDLEEKYFLIQLTKTIKVKRGIRIYFLGFLVLAILAACAQLPISTLEPIQQPTNEPIVEATSAPSETASLEFTIEPTATISPELTTTNSPAERASPIPTPINFVTLGSPFAKDCGDGVVRIFSNDSFNAPGLDHQFDDQHGHVDLYVPLGCNVNNMEGEVISPASGTLYGDGNSYQLFLPYGTLIKGVESALIFSGEENIDLNKITKIRLDFGHIEPFVGTATVGLLEQLEKGQPFADVVPYDDQQKIAYQIWVDYDGDTFMFSPTLFEQDGPEWTCVIGSKYDCLPEPHDYVD